MNLLIAALAFWLAHRFARCPHCRHREDSAAQ